MIISSVVFLVIGLVPAGLAGCGAAHHHLRIGAAALLYGGFRIVDFFVRKEHLA